jgi:hypothetical protein
MVPVTNGASTHPILLLEDRKHEGHGLGGGARGVDQRVVVQRFEAGGI